MRAFNLPILIAILALSMGCGSLENTASRPSPYAGNTALYDVDLAIVTNQKLLDTFVSWERDNRKLINNLDVKHVADNVRAHAKEWFGSATRLRKAYQLDPSRTNKDALNAALDVITQALAESLGYMTKYTTQKKV